MTEDLEACPACGGRRVIGAGHACGRQRGRCPSDFAFRSDRTPAQLGALRAGLDIGVCQVPLAARDHNVRRIVPGFCHGLEVWLGSHRKQRGADEDDSGGARGRTC